MTSLSKHVNTEEGEDRISSLPDEILVHILSLLPTENAVITSILSLRWKDLWAFVPTLYFDGWMSAKTVPHNDLSFMNFVDDVLLRHKSSSIERFTVRAHAGVEASRLREWIRIAILRNVQVIDIQTFENTRFSFPSELFTCKTLIQLSLVSALQFDTPLSSVWLPNLKNLHVSLDYPGNDTTQKLFSNCPMLEDLCIDANMDFEEDIVFNVCAPALKKLQFNLVALLEDDYSERGVVLPRNKIVVDAPVLEVLIIGDDYLACYSLNNLSSLVSASIDVGDYCIHTIRMKENANQIFKLLEGITNVKFLTLHKVTMEVLDFADDNKLPLFPNLIRLKLVVPNSFSWRRLPDLLGSAPNLAALELWKNHVSEGDRKYRFACCWPQSTPNCFLSKLEELLIYQCHGKDDELKLLKYIVENAPVLKKVAIGSCHLTLEERRNFVKEVMTFRRASKTCRIMLCTIPNHLLDLLWKYWLKGEKAGTSEDMAILPGLLDNIRTNEKGEFWVAIHTRRAMYTHLWGLYPTLRKILLRLPIPLKIRTVLYTRGSPHSVVVKYSTEGKLLQILEDRQGKVVKAVSEVEEKDGKLWMGSVLMPFIAVYQL